MFSIILKVLSITLSTLYISENILGISNTFKLRYHKFLFISDLIISMFSFVFYNQEHILYYIFLSMLWFITSLHTAQPQTSFIATVLSFSLSYCAHASISFILSLGFSFVFRHPNPMPYEIFALLSSSAQIILTGILLRTKRFRKGMPFLKNKSIINISTIICVFIIVLSFLFASFTGAPFLLFGVGCTFFFTLAFLIFWWQSQITKSYKQRLFMSELEARRASDPEKDAEIERLSTILHRNGNLLNALRDATIIGLSTDFETEEERLATRNRLISNINIAAAECENISSDYRREKTRNFGTELPLLDDILQRLDGDAIEQKITFQVYIGVSLKDYVPAFISESDLTYTVNDLLRNAFKATSTREKRIVQLQFYNLGKHLVVEVSDNGIPFEVRSLVNMGIEKRTTYEDGSGIGLMDIWSTKEKYRATYHLDEYATAAPFSKKISLTFDKKNRYSIRTWRKDEILKMSRRADLQVYEHVD